MGLRPITRIAVFRGVIVLYDTASTGLTMDNRYIYIRGIGSNTY